jgi:hypothetical protein
MFRVHPIQLRRATEAPHIHFLTTTPDDPRAYIIASNIARRHMSKGQQAMAVASISEHRLQRRVHTYRDYIDLDRLRQRITEPSCAARAEHSA